MNSRQNIPTVPPHASQLPMKDASRLPKFRAQFVFDAPGQPGGEATIAAASMIEATMMILSQVNQVALPIKQFTIQQIDAPLIFTPQN